MKTFIKVELVTNYLKENNISKAELCRKSGVSINVLNKILADKRNIRIDGLLKVFIAIGAKSIFNF